MRPSPQITKELLEMNINYLLFFSGDHSGGQEASVRCFTKLEAARTAMAEAYRKYAAALNIPVSHSALCDQYTTKTKNTIHLERYGDHFQWEIIKAVPEDGDSTESTKQQRGLTNYTVTIEEHIAQTFSVRAYDIFHAIGFAEMAYKQGEFVVQSSTPNARLIMAENAETGETTEWKEF